MTIEKLTEARFKVIADWPGCTYVIGDILTPIITQIGNLNKYPHLFRRLYWYEERNLEELPKYIKMRDTVYLVKEWKKSMFKDDYHASNRNEEGSDILNISWYFAKKESLPATKEEFINQTNNI